MMAIGKMALFGERELFIKKMGLLKVVNGTMVHLYKL